MQPTLIVIEGLDGSGKATQTTLLEAKLKEMGIPVRRVSFPDYAEPSSELVKMYLGGAFGSDPDAVNAYAASLFYAVDRYASYKRLWQADYENGTVILADRYVTSNAIYQMTKLPQTQWPEFLQWLSDLEYDKMGLPRPQQTIYLDMPPEVSQKMLSARYRGDESKKDIHESHVEFLRQCRATALYAGERWHWRRIGCAEDDAPRPIDAIAKQVLEAAMEVLDD
ncbi:MAG: deoxynucleoside kinase [Clostridia bacterium]|nr:deoxynucleoside kinase [Clostridia bacterium]